MIIFVDIDETICHTSNSDYPNSTPIQENIEKINKLYDDGHDIIYWTARGASSGKNWNVLTLKQLFDWGCKFSQLRSDKPNYDLMICDKTQRIEEI